MTLHYHTVIYQNIIVGRYVEHHKNLISFCIAEWENLGKRHYLQSEAPTSKYLNGNPDKKMSVGAAEERIYAQVGTLDPQNHQHPPLQPNQIFYNAQFDIDTMGKVPRKLKISIIIM